MPKKRKIKEISDDYLNISSPETNEMFTPPPPPTPLAPAPKRGGRPQNPNTKNTRGRNENMTKEQIEKNRARQRKANLTPAQIEKKNARQRKVNMTPAQIEKKNARNRNENLTPEQIEQNRARKRKANLTPAQIEQNRARQRKYQQQYQQQLVLVKGETKPITINAWKQRKYVAKKKGIRLDNSMVEFVDDPLTQNDPLSENIDKSTHRPSKKRKKESTIVNSTTNQVTEADSLPITSITEITPEEEQNALAGLLSPQIMQENNTESSYEEKEPYLTQFFSNDPSLPNPTSNNLNPEDNVPIALVNELDLTSDSQNPLGIFGIFASTQPRTFTQLLNDEDPIDDFGFGF